MIIIHTLFALQLLCLVYLIWPKRLQFIKTQCITFKIDKSGKNILLWIVGVLYLYQFISAFFIDYTTASTIIYFWIIISISSITCFFDIILLVKEYITEKVINIRYIVWIIFFSSYIVEYLIRGI